MEHPDNKKHKKRFKTPIVVIIMIMLAIVAGIIAGSIGFNKLYGDGNDIISQLQARREAMPDQESIEQHKAERQKEKEAAKAQAQAEAEAAEAAKYPEVVTLLEEEPEDISKCRKLTPKTASASSVIYQKGINNNADRVLNDNKDSSWQEGVDGDGIGEWLKFDFTQKKTLRYMKLKLGNWSSDWYYTSNNRPKILEIQTDAGMKQITFPDEKKDYWLAFPKDWTTDDVKLIIRAVYKGTEWDDTCVTEIAMYEEK